MSGSDEPAKGRIGTVILAAGESARMGQPKQLLAYRGTTLLGHAAETAIALACGPVAVVLGAFAAKIRPTLEKLPVLVVENSDWREGMGTSLRTGLREVLLDYPEIDGALFMLCDQPLITTDALRALIEMQRRTRKPIVATEHSDTLGVPAIFARPLFAELLTLSGKEGARLVIQRHRADAASLPIMEAATDVDTATDFAALPDC